MHRWFPVVLALLLTAAPAAAQTRDAIELVPDDALGFILIKDLTQLSTKMERMARRLEAKEHFSVLELVKKEMGIEKGLNEKGSAVLIVARPDKEKEFPTAVLAVPVADYRQFAGQLGVKAGRDKIVMGTITLPGRGGLAGVSDSKGQKREAQERPKVKVLIARKGNFALLAHPTDRAVLQRIVDAKKSLAATLRPAQAWLEEQDLSGVCTDRGIKVGLGLLVANAYHAAGSDTRQQSKQLEAAFTDIDKNVKLIAFGGHIDKEGHSRLLTRLYANPESTYARWLARARPLTGDLLARFPARPYYVAILAELSAQVRLEGMKDLLPKGAFSARVEESIGDIDRLLTQVSQAGLVVYRGKADRKNSSLSEGQPLGAGIPSGEPVLRAIVKDAPAFVGDAARLLTRLQNGATGEGKWEKLQVNGKTAALVPVTIKSERPSDKEEGKTRKSQTIRILLVALDGKTVLAGALPAKDQAERWVEQVVGHKGKDLAADRLLKKTAALLPDKLQVVGYVNVKEMATMMPARPSAPAFPDAPPLAYALRVFDAGVEAQFVLPFEVVKAFFQMGRQGSSKKGK